MTHMTPRPERLANYAWHAALGYDLLVLTVLRLLWRWMNPVPVLPGDLTRWEALAARFGHAGLYLLTLAASIVGWALADTMRSPMNSDLLGLAFPSLIADKSWHRLLENVHEILAYLLAALVLAHIAGALRHHFVKKNDVLRRMV
jgi:cytochrome b561